MRTLATYKCKEAPQAIFLCMPVFIVPCGVVIQESVRFCCILVPRALKITRVVVSSYIKERKENRCESKSRVKSRWCKDQVYGPNKRAGDNYKPRRVDYVIDRLIAKTLTERKGCINRYTSRSRHGPNTVRDAFMAK